MLDKSLGIEKAVNLKAESNDPKQIGAPLQGLLSKVMVTKDQKVKRNEPLFVIEAMKMETTITAPENVQIKLINLKEGVMVNAEDLVITLN